ncbi:hypothetical protein [Amycolatopsis plumensis]|uniref:hypothetical protein n=1 Tax=Amycolatopsis plumensis TaxID=236508 RepID=UPI00360FF5AB
MRVEIVDDTASPSSAGPGPGSSPVRGCGVNGLRHNGFTGRAPGCTAGCPDQSHRL